MELRSQLSAVRREMLCAISRRVAPIGDRGPYVSFSFDDFPRTAYTAGGRILESHGTRGTYYTAMALMNVETEVGPQFSRDDLLSVLQDGHELASHTLSHISCRSISSAAFQEDVERGRAALLNAAGISTAGNFAYPFGHVTLGAKKAVGSKMSSCRGTFAGINGPQVDLNLLRANSLYGDLSEAAAAHQLIKDTEEAGGWLIFYSHDVSPNPSLYGCTPALLESVVSCAVRGRCRVMTVKDVLAQIVGDQPESESASERELSRSPRSEADPCK